MTKIAQLLGMRETEWKRTFLLQIYLFNLICVLLLLKPVSNALLISEWGIEGLPIVFICIAIVAYYFTKLYNNLYQKFKFIDLHRGFMYFIVVSLIGFIAAFYFFPNASYLVFGFYIWVALYALVSTSQFWILCNIVFNAREAKRVFGVIGSGGIAGGIAGGYLASILVSYTSNIGLMAISVVLLSLTIPIANRVWNRYNKGLKKGSLVTSKRKRKIQKFSFRRLAKDKHIILLAVITGLGVIVAKLVDFQFQNYASIRFTSSEELTAFFGFWLSTFNVIGFVVQLFFTGRILRYFGVDKTQFILPISLVFVSSISFFAPILAVFIVLRGTEGVFKQSIQRSVNELLILPVAPEIKSQSKTFIDVFVDSMATGISGLMLLGIMTFGVANNRVVYITTLFTIALSILWVIISFLIKNSYMDSFRRQFLKLDRKNKEGETTTSILNTVEHLFNVKNDEELLTLLHNLEDFELSTKVLLRLLQHSDSRIRLKALERITAERDREVLEAIKILHDDSDISVQVGAYIYDIENNSRLSAKQQLEILNSQDQKISIPYLFACAAYYSLDNATLEKLEIFERVKKLAEDRLTNNPEGEDEVFVFELLRAIARGRFVPLYKHVDELLTVDGRLKRSAIRASVYTLSRKYAERLIHILVDPVYGDYAMRSLLFYDEAIIPIMRKLQVTGQISKATLAKCFELLAQIPSQNALNYLLLHLNHKSFGVRKEVIWQLSSMKRSFPNLDYKSNTFYKRIVREVKSINKLMAIYLSFQLQLEGGPVKELTTRDRIVKLIQKRIKLQIDKRFINVFLVLGLEHNKQDIHDVYNGLVSNNHLRKSYSLEFLELLVDYRYVKLLTPIVEVSFQKKLKPELLIKLGVKPMYFPKAFSSIAKYPDKKLTLLLTKLVHEKGYEIYTPYLHDAKLSKRNRYLRNRLKSLGAKKTS